MKTLLKLPVSVVKVILSVAALPFGLLVILCVVIAYTDYKALFVKKKEKTAET